MRIFVNVFVVVIVQYMKEWKPRNAVFFKNKKPFYVI